MDEQGALYSLMKDHYESEKNDDNLKRVIAINDKYIGLLASANRFSTAKDVMAERLNLSYASTQIISFELMKPINKSIFRVRNETLIYPWLPNNERILCPCDAETLCT